MRYALVLASLLALMPPAADSADSPDGPSGAPKCESERVGEFWPAEANHSRQELKQAIDCGTLYICSRNRYRRYRWARLTVSLSELSGKAPSCRQTVAATTESIPSIAANFESSPAPR